jgi:hypothetical protein
VCESDDDDGIWAIEEGEALEDALLSMRVGEKALVIVDCSNKLDSSGIPTYTFSETMEMETRMEVQETTHGLGTGTEIEGKLSSKRKLFEIEVDLVASSFKQASYNALRLFVEKSSSLVPLAALNR